jgi:hypothetical protein
MSQNPAYHGVMYKHSELTEEIIGAFFAVYNALGYGFLEKGYVNALKNGGWPTRQNHKFSVYLRSSASK